MKSSTIAMMVSMVVLAATGCAAGSEDTAASLTSAIETVGDNSTAETTATDGGRPRGHRKPPEEAFTACESKAAGDACTVVHGDKSIEGKCVAPPDGAEDTRIHCRPDGAPPGGGGPGGPGRNGGGDCPGKGDRPPPAAAEGEAETPS